MRAEETAREERLIDDPYAAMFVAAAPPLFADVPLLADDASLAALVESGIAGVALRTRYFDDALEAACSAGCRQVVLLAAGLDTRGFRLELPDGVRLFELDLPDLFGFKEGVLAEHGVKPRCDRRVVSVDLRDDWPTQLIEAGFDPGRVTAWIAEGLLVYLDHDEAVRLLTAVCDLSVRESRLSFDFDPRDVGSTLRRAQDMVGMERVAGMWHGGLREDPRVWLSRRGWTVEAVDRATFALSHQREMVDPTGAFLTATCTGADHRKGCRSAP